QGSVDALDNLTELAWVFRNVCARAKLTFGRGLRQHLCVGDKRVEVFHQADKSWYHFVLLGPPPDLSKFFQPIEVPLCDAFYGVDDTAHSLLRRRDRF